MHEASQQSRVGRLAFGVVTLVMSVACSSSGESSDGGDDAGSMDSGPVAVSDGGFLDAGRTCDGSFGSEGGPEGGLACALDCSSTFASSISVMSRSGDSYCAMLTDMPASWCEIVPTGTCTASITCQSTDSAGSTFTCDGPFTVSGTTASGQCNGIWESDPPNAAYHGCIFAFTGTIEN